MSNYDSGYTYNCKLKYYYEKDKYLYFEIDYDLNSDGSTFKK